MHERAGGQLAQPGPEPGAGAPRGWGGSSRRGRWGRRVKRGAPVRSLQFKAGGVVSSAGKYCCLFPLPRREERW